MRAQGTSVIGVGAWAFHTARTRSGTEVMIAMIISRPASAARYVGHPPSANAAPSSGSSERLTSFSAAERGRPRQGAAI